MREVNYGRFQELQGLRAEYERLSFILSHAPVFGCPNLTQSIMDRIGVLTTRKRNEEYLKQVRQRVSEIESRFSLEHTDLSSIRKEWDTSKYISHWPINVLKSGMRRMGLPTMNLGEYIGNLDKLIDSIEGVPEIGNAVYYSRNGIIPLQLNSGRNSLCLAITPTINNSNSARDIIFLKKTIDDVLTDARLQDIPTRYVDYLVLTQPEFDRLLEAVPRFSYSAKVESINEAKETA